MTAVVSSFMSITLFYLFFLCNCSLYLNLLLYSVSLLTRERAHCRLKYIRALSASVISPGKRRVAMLIKPTDVEETAENDGEYYSDTDVGAFPFDTCWLDAKLQLKLEQKMRMKVPKRIRLRRKKLVRKRRMRKKGRWPPSKMK